MTTNDTDTIRLAELPAHSLRIRSLWLAPGALHRETVVLIAVADAPGLAARLGLSDAELYHDPQGGHAPSICLGMAVVTNMEPLALQPLPAYSAKEAARLTKLLAKPKQEADLRRLREDAARAEREEAGKREIERQRRVKQEQEALL